MITTGSTSGLKMLCDDEKNFYPNMPKLPFSDYGQSKRRLLLEAYMHWLMDEREVYWTDYVLGWVRTRILVEEGKEDTFKNIKMLEPDYIAKRMWDDINNEIYKHSFIVGLDNKSWTVSLFSEIRSSFTVTVNVLTVSPGLKVTLPLVAL